MDKMLSEANSFYQAGERAKALYLYTCCKENKQYLEDDSYRIDVNNAVKQILQRRGRLAGYTMPRPAGSILPDELYQTAQMIRDSNAIPEEKKSVHIHIYLSGAAEMGYAPAQFDMAAGDWLKPQAALEYCEKAAAQGYKKAIELLPTLKQRVKLGEMELNEGNVQAIFNRCLAKEESKEITRTALFSTLLGYSEQEEIVLEFDQAALAKNKKNIVYLYGQLSAVHTGKGLKNRLAAADFSDNYQGKPWHSDETGLLQLLYLGCNHAVSLMYPFSKKDHDTTVLSKDLKPTLSPKDPAFPAWWEAHKGEWEQ